MHVVVCAAFVVLVVALTSDQVDGFKVQYTVISQGRAVGDILVLDVGSLWPKHPAAPSRSITKTSECQERCSVLPGCTAYAFCAREGGCGTGCQNYTKKHPSITTEQAAVASDRRGGRSSGDQQDSQLQVPVLSFGPYVPDSTAAGCDRKQSDRWAFGTCTLLKSRSMSPRTVQSAAEGSGWVSAHLKSSLPATCSGVSATACAACYATAKPDVCLSCMKDQRSGVAANSISLISDGRLPGSSGSRSLDQCAACADLNTTELQDKCVSCVLDSKACRSCVPYPGTAARIPAAAVGGCMACVEARGQRFTGACLTCSAAPDPGKCYSCLEQFYPATVCKTSSHLDCYKPDYDNPCASCQSGAANAYDSCIACYSDPASKPDCDFCNQLADQTQQLPCFECSQRSKAAHSDTPGGCGLCFAHSKDAKTQQQCVDCVASSSTPKHNKQHCHLCASISLTQQQASRCYSCLRSSSGGPDCSTCAEAATTEPTFDSCVVCYDISANGPDCDECSKLHVVSSRQGADSGDDVRNRCYNCVVGSNLEVPNDAGFAPIGSCAACLSGDKQEQDIASCVACNTNPKVSMYAKSWCDGCSSKSTSAGRVACLECLQVHMAVDSIDYMKTCKLSTPD